MTRADEAAEARPVPLVEILFIDGCPNHQAVLARVGVLVRACGIHTRVQVRRIPDEPTAVRERFLGSPTVRIAGRDVEPGAGDRTDFGMACRLYATDAGLLPEPLDRWVLDALHRPDS